MAGNYKDTINLPKTAFPMEARLTQHEPKIRQKWEEEKLYHKIRQARKGAPKYILHDGPPYANGDVHIGTGQNKILKDIVVRYKTMQGFDSPYIPGWDCHGLPIEHKVTEKLGAKAREMEKSKIRELCQEFATKYIDIQRRQFKSLGVLGDWERPYLTFDPQYEVAIIETFEEMFKRGHIYKRNRPIHWCMNCRTALAEAELEYKNLPSPSIYVKFRIPMQHLERRKISVTGKDVTFELKDKDVNLLIWTTTPWTLPANVATVVHPNLEYSVVEVAGERFIVCKNTLERLAKRFGWTNCEMLGTVQGALLENVLYHHPLTEEHCPIVLANYVRVEDGTGCVHTAPGHGEEDYQTGLKYDLPIFSPVDEGGKFTSDAKEFSGKNVFDANPEICEVLKKKGLMLKQEEFSHDYPCCWRCKKPVIFRATEQWFISVDKNDGRKKALEVIKNTRWVPKWGEIRISSMLAERPDWCISRQRTWGVPIPAFYCSNSKCNELMLSEETLSAIKDLFTKSGANAWFTTPPSEILPKGTKCKKCGCGEFKKENDIFDVWFESAASHRAVCMKHPELKDHFPPELYLEGTDQHRGWFQVSLLSSILSQGKAPFQTVVTHGFLVDARTGDKLSKSGFLIPVDEVVAKLGADILRLWISSIDFTDDLPISWEILKERTEPYKKIRNTFRFLLGNVSDFDPQKDAVSYDKMLDIDKHSLLELNLLITDVTKFYDNFELSKAYHALYNFCVVNMSATYFAILKDRLYTAGKNSPERRSAQTALYEILTALTKMFAPILCHTTDEIWGYVPGKKEENVALAEWPKPIEKWNNAQLRSDFQDIYVIRAEAYKELEKLRADKIIGSSLEATVTLYSTDGDILKKYSTNLPELLIVSDVKVVDTKPSDAIESNAIKGLAIKVSKSPHQKCERCWNLRESVGRDKNHPTLCDKCVKVVATL